MNPSQVFDFLPVTNRKWEFFLQKKISKIVFHANLKLDDKAQSYHLFEQAVQLKLTHFLEGLNDLK